MVNGSNFKFIGTNVYWLPSLNTNEDMWNTLSNISALGINVVRIWAFNDVDTIPENGTWFQLVRNGTVSVNTGPNGLQKLDTVIEMAEQLGLYVILSLTNNWFPQPSLDSPLAPINSSIFDSGVEKRAVVQGTNNTLPRNYLSNDYGGMDLYVHQYGYTEHDQFYTDPTILNSFLNYTTQVVSRYVNSPAIFSWELANDPRCNSTLPSTANCTTETVTTWHATVATHVQTVDPNHLVSAGTSGFICLDCPKLYPLNPAPAPAPSASPAAKKRRSIVPRGPLTKEQLLRDRAEARRHNRAAAKLAGTLKEDGVKIRGRWVSTAAKRQGTQDIGPTYTGAYGVDSQDILNIPQIGFGSFQLFPDQQQYEPNDPNLSPYENIVNQGVAWIIQQAQSAAAVGKPVALSGFGLVTQNNSASFVPFNSTVAPYAPDSSSSTGNNTSQPYGVTSTQQTDAYSQWLDSGIAAGVNGIMQYQWGQGGLTTQPGTAISPDTSTQSSNQGSTGQSGNTDTTGQSPNDGYSSYGSNGVQQTLQNGVQQMGQDP
ncbi:glycoside hydrolase family 5 protein [Serpula lacrymans var. lacrymans S7.3]|uniref:mannan endo-1,4-beta-mannosidase n=2 Tax=Serpula lacrymans var. lacrymans TaxID=341189 RepID=F8QGW0_SERL3|nr:glycoside hydrolase family 5 protein [Serpula lacrymans var. lacrymans S7.9]EGN92442.1 glycoside hydrolase family 5 protein [Serpula lacrymans var. lacrymans S7.3]EGO18569.1 glycoside hydrolase family 5 protein [Serpula lacrymans var. lacrymans S7.9]